MDDLGIVSVNHGHIGGGSLFWPSVTHSEGYSEKVLHLYVYKVEMYLTVCFATLNDMISLKIF